jgi:membrane protein implicated in regulation of membrane protease activity
MTERSAPELDMTLEGEFVSPPRLPITSRILVWVILIAVIAGSLTLAAFALWLALLIFPIALGAAIIAWVLFKFQVWRGQKSLGGQGDLWRT